MSSIIHLDSSEQTEAAGSRLAQDIREQGRAALVIYLHGDLGAGKTTFARGFLRGLGHTGRVPSPTYTLIEPYELAGYSVSHIDLYRLRSPAEAGALALDELGGDGTIMLIEWPDKGGPLLPPADLRIEFEVAGRGRTLRLDGAAATEFSFFVKN